MVQVWIQIESFLVSINCTDFKLSSPPSLLAFMQLILLTLKSVFNVLNVHNSPFLEKKIVGCNL